MKPSDIFDKSLKNTWEKVVFPTNIKNIPKITDEQQRKIIIAWAKDEIKQYQALIKRLKQDNGK